MMYHDTQRVTSLDDVSDSVLKMIERKVNTEDSDANCNIYRDYGETYVTVHATNWVRAIILLDTLFDFIKASGLNVK